MYKLFVTTALSVFIAGCAIPYRQPVATENPDIALEMSSTALVFRNVRVETTSHGASLVRGTLRRTGYWPARAGHIDFRLTDAGGRVLEQGRASDGRAGEGPHRKHPNHTSTFVIPLQTPWIPGQHRLYLKWDATVPGDTPTKPPHVSIEDAGGQV